MSQQTTIANASAVPTADDVKSVDLAPSTGGSKYVINQYDDGIYILKNVVSLVGSNAGPVSPGTLIIL